MNRPVPEYADFDDYRHTQYVVVTIRWIILFSWIALRHYNNPYDSVEIVLDVVGGTLAVMNLWLQYRLIKGRPVGRDTVMVASVVDLTLITVGLAITSGFSNNFFVLYYPALIGMAVVVASTIRGAIIVTATAGAYAAISMIVEPGIDLDVGAEKSLLMRIAAMYASVLVVYLTMRTERRRRLEAVTRERDEAARNLELQKVAQEAELKASEQRFQISREIHDGIAQNLYGLSLNLEAAANSAQSGDLAATREKLDVLVPLAKQSLLETRHYMHDLRPLLGKSGDLSRSIKNLAEEFETISGVDVHVTVRGKRVQVTDERAAQVCRIIQEALANVMRHSGASRVNLEVEYSEKDISVQIRDDGKGFDTSMNSSGFGLENMRSRATEVDGDAEIVSSPGQGTTVSVRMPVQRTGGR